MDGWMDGWMDGGMGGWMGGCIDGLFGAQPQPQVHLLEKEGFPAKSRKLPV